MHVLPDESHVLPDEPHVLPDEPHVLPDESIGVFVLGLEPPAERARLRAHLDGCPVCRAEWTALRDLPPLLASMAAQWTPRPMTGEATLAAIRTPPPPA